MSGAQQRIRAVSFDVDGTLYATRSFALMLRVLWVNRARLRAMRVGRAVREELRVRDFADGASLREEEARIAAERLGLSSADARAQMDLAFDDGLCACLRPDPGVVAAVRSLADAGLALALISDRRIDDKLRALGLGELPWRARVCADDTGALKPSPRPFLLACERMAVSPDACMHVGDRQDSDGAGAAAAGARFTLVEGPRDLARVAQEILSEVKASR